MAYETIVIDYEELHDVQAGLAFVNQELGNIESIAETIIGMIGDPEPDLKGAVEDFHGSWDDNRADILKVTGDMEEAVGKVIENWNEWDQKQAQNFEGAPN